MVAESDVLIEDGSLSFREDQLQPLIDLSVYLWEAGLVDAVQSSTENGGFGYLQDIREGNSVFACPFAVIDNESFEKINCSELICSKYFGAVQCTELTNNGMLIRQTPK